MIVTLTKFFDNGVAPYAPANVHLLNETTSNQTRHSANALPIDNLNDNELDFRSEDMIRENAHNSQKKPLS
jgi:GTPase Era involved in 16S rRNA processing